MRRFYYLGSLVIVFAIPAVAISFFIINQIPLVNFIFFILGIVLLGSIWDIWATRHGKRDAVWLWQFNPADTLGVTFFGLPIEEYLFYLFSSTYIIFMWEGIRLALVTGVGTLAILVPCLALWSLLGAMLPYRIRPKGDKI